MQLPAEQGQKRSSPSLRLTRDQLCQSAALAPRSIRHLTRLKFGRVGKMIMMCRFFRCRKQPKFQLNLQLQQNDRRRRDAHRKLIFTARWGPCINCMPVSYLGKLLYHILTSNLQLRNNTVPLDPYSVPIIRLHDQTSARKLKAHCGPEVNAWQGYCLALCLVRSIRRLFQVIV